jgi:serine/threonine protein kinase
LYERKSDGSLVIIRSCSSSGELEREVESYCRLGRHPLLLPLLDVFEEGGQLHLVVPHCSRGDSRTWFETVKVGTPQRVLFLLLDYWISSLNDV